MDSFSISQTSVGLSSHQYDEKYTCTDLNRAWQTVGTVINHRFWSKLHYCCGAIQIQSGTVWKNPLCGAIQEDFTSLRLTQLMPFDITQ